MSPTKLVLSIVASVFCTFVLASAFFVQFFKTSASTDCSSIDRDTFRPVGNVLLALDAKNASRLCVWENQKNGWIPIPESNGSVTPVAPPQSSTSTK